MLTPNAVESNNGNWIPTINHHSRTYFKIEQFPRQLRRTKREAIEYAERVISGRDRSSFVLLLLGGDARPAQ